MDHEGVRIVIETLKEKGYYNAKPDSIYAVNRLHERLIHVSIVNTFFAVLNLVFLTFLVNNDYPKEVVIETIFVENLLLLFVVIKSFIHEKEAWWIFATLEICIFIITLIISAFYPISFFNSVIAGLCFCCSLIGLVNVSELKKIS